MAVDKAGAEKPAEKIDEKLAEQASQRRPGEVKPIAVRAAKIERNPSAPRLHAVSDSDAQTLRQLHGESAFERAPARAPSGERALSRFRGTQALIEARREWVPPEGVATGLRASAINFGGASIGVAELIGLTFKVNHYFMPVTYELARSSRPEGEDLQKWKGDGVTAVVSLTAETGKFTEAARANGLNALRVKIIDNTARAKIFSSKAAQNAVLDQRIKEIADFVRANKRTVIHCQAGIGRTGMVVACLQMALYGMSEKDAIDQALQVASAKNRVKRVVMVPAQIEYIHHFAVALRTGAISGYPLP